MNESQLNQFSYLINQMAMALYNDKQIPASLEWQFKTAFYAYMSEQKEEEPPTEGQLNYLADLGCKSIPKTKTDANLKIRELTSVDAKPTERQLAYLKDLGCRGVPESKQEAAKWIKAILNNEM